MAFHQPKVYENFQYKRNGFNRRWPTPKVVKNGSRFCRCRIFSILHSCFSFTRGMKCTFNNDRNCASCGEISLPNEISTYVLRYHWWSHVDCEEMKDFSSSSLSSFSPSHHHCLTHAAVVAADDDGLLQIPHQKARNAGTAWMNLTPNLFENLRRKTSK